MTFASAAVRVATLYLEAGILPALAFVLVGAGRRDPAAAHGSPGFRLAVLPGAILLWPVVTWKWLASARRGGAR